MYLGLVEPPLIDEPKQLGQVGKQGKSQVYVTEEEGERGWERSHRMGFQVHCSGLGVGSAPQASSSCLEILTAWGTGFLVCKETNSRSPPDAGGLVLDNVSVLVSHLHPALERQWKVECLTSCDTAGWGIQMLPMQHCLSVRCILPAFSSLLMLHSKHFQWISLNNPITMAMKVK